MNNIKLWSVLGVIFTSVTGTLLHFVYERFDGRVWAIVGAVNESTWEHLKLLFWPMVAFTLVEYLFYGKNTPGFIQVKALSILLGMAVVVVGFYTYTGVLGSNIAIVDVSLFFAGVVIAYCFFYKNISRDRAIYKSSFFDTVAIAIIVTLGILFAIFTSMPPQIDLFKDPLSEIM
ncbi:MAG: hypothetical protein GX663_03385 [Clostridiales bacterium]|nr:hypothetical protein [Clostridiales bacterium]